MFSNVAGNTQFNLIICRIQIWIHGNYDGIDGFSTAQIDKKENFVLLLVLR